MTAALTSNRQARLLLIVARAAPPHERVDRRFYTPSKARDPQRIAALAEQACRTVANGSRETFDAVLEWQGLSRTAFEEGLCPVELADPASLPPWARALHELLGAVAVQDVEPPAGVRPSPVAPITAAAGRILAQQLADFGAGVAPGAQTGMLDVFRNRLWQALGPLLDFETRSAAASAGFVPATAGTVCGPDASLDGWLERFERFPGAAYLTGTCFLNWRRFVFEVIERVAADADVLRSDLLGGMAHGVLTGFRGDAGDVHGNGRSVAILTFDSGKKVVYKPKDLRIATAFMELLRLLNEQGLDPPLRLRRIVTRGNYTWEEFVENRACESIEDVERFFVRMGMLIRLLQLLEGRDFWLDNLIAEGDQPVFIDLEMLLQPRPPLRGLLPSEHEARRLLAESALETCAIVMPTPIEAGIATEDLGALAAPRLFVSPFRHTPQVPGKASNPLTTDDFIRWRHPEHAPVLNGQPALAENHFEAICRGYERMQALLSACRNMLLEENGPLGSFRDVPVRYICRDTWTCQKITQRSVAPALLADPVKRDLFLHELVRPALTETMEEDARMAQCALVRSEITALRDLDVPLFLSRPNVPSAFTLEGQEIRRRFDDTAWDRLHERVLHVDTFPLAEQLQLVASCFSTAHEKCALVRSPAVPADRADASHGGPPYRWLDEAIAIGDALLEARIAVGPEDAAWLGLVYHPSIDLLSLGVLQADLLTGSGGLAVLLSDLYAATGEERFRSSAHAALASTLKAVADAPRAWQSYGRPDQRHAGPIHSGGFLGTGAHLYCLRYCAMALCDSGLGRVADAHQCSLPVSTLIAHSGTDVVAGTAGLLLAMTGSASDGARAIAREVAGHVVAARGADGTLAPPRYPRPARVVAVPDGTAGLALGLNRLVAQGFSDLLRPLNELRSHLFPPQGDPDPDVATPGRVLARLEIACSASERRAALAEADAILARDVPASETRALLDALEIATAASDVADSARHYLDRAAEIATRLVSERRACGAWFPGLFTADRHNLSVVWGVPAIARGLLRLHDRTLPSVRLLRLPERVGPHTVHPRV